MNSGPESSLHTYKAFLNGEDIDRIVQSCVYLSDHVFLPSSVAPAPNLDTSAQSNIVRRLHELYEMGAIKFWEIEGQSDFLASSQPSMVNTSFEASHVIPSDLYQDLYQKIVQRLADNRMRFLGTAHPGSLDGVAEFVIGKHALWTMSLNDYLNTNRIVFDPNAAKNTTRFFADLLAKTITTEKVIEKVLYRFNIPDLSLLSSKEIEKCRNLLPSFRSEIAERVNNSAQSLQFQEEEIAEKIAKQLFDEFYDSIQRKFIDNPGLSAVEWNIGKLDLSPTVKSQHASCFFGWEKERKPIPPVFQLLEVRKIAKGHDV